METDINGESLRECLEVGCGRLSRRYGDVGVDEVVDGPIRLKYISNCRVKMITN